MYSVTPDGFLLSLFSLVFVRIFRCASDVLKLACAYILLYDILFLDYFSMQFSMCNLLKYFYFSGDGEIRTLDPLLARQVLSQLSYAPLVKVFTFFNCFLLEWA